MSDLLIRHALCQGMPGSDKSPGLYVRLVCSGARLAGEDERFFAEAQESAVCFALMP